MCSSSYRKEILGLILVILVLTPLVPAALVQWTVASGGNGHWYEAVKTTAYINFADAKAAAESRGGYLATIHSEAENAFVYALASADAGMWHFDDYNNGMGPWLGGYQYDRLAEPAGHWTWVTGEPWSYTNWGTGQPDNAWGGSEDYLHFFGYHTLMSPMWNDLGSGAWPLGYVVEIIPEPATLVLLALGGLLLSRKPRA